VKKYFFLLLLLVHLGGGALVAQNDHGITNRSDVVQVVDGKPYYFHAVLQGQTLYSIARAYGVTVGEIIRENPDLEHGLRFDQIIRIPAQSQQNPAAEEAQPGTPDKRFMEHNVRRGETLYGIARQYSITMEEILEHNPQAASGLRPRDVLRIPQKTRHQQAQAPEQPDGKVHTVAAGETLFSISRNYGFSVDDLIRFNPGLTTDIQPGQQIRIPEIVTLPMEAEFPTQPEGLVFLPADEEKPEQVEPAPYPDCQDVILKQHYKVALLIPLYLEELDSLPALGSMPSAHRSFSFIEYYKGLLIALDSVKADTGAEITLHVFDVDQNLGKARDVINQTGFSDMDLIIGPFHSQPLSLVAGFGLRNDIPVVSPLLDDRNQLRGFPNLFQATPSMRAQLDDLAGYIARTYNDQNIILVHNSQAQAMELITGFKESLSREMRRTRHFQDSLNLARINGYFVNGALVGERLTNVMVINDTILATRTPEIPPARYQRENPLKEVIFVREGVEGVLKKLSANQKNIVVTLIGGEAFLSDYLRQLYLEAREYDVAVFGTPQWQNYQSIEIDYLQGLNVHIFSPDYLDFRDPHVRDFVLRYREVFRSEPQDYAFKGVQAGWFFFNALVHYGENFSNCIRQLNTWHYENPFVFDRTMGPNAGWENKKTTLFRYENFRKVDVRKVIPQAAASGN
jgi:LysM repeat protein